MANGKSKFDPTKSAKNFAKAAKAAAPLATPTKGGLEQARVAGLSALDPLTGRSLRGSKTFTKAEIERGFRRL